MPQIDQNSILWPHPTLMPLQLVVPVSAATLYRRGIVTIADLDDQWYSAGIGYEVECHTLRAKFPANVKSNLHALRINSIDVVCNISAARCAEVAGTDIAREGERPVADRGHARVERVVRNVILQVDIS